jgi:hypothetical protein
MRHGERPGLQPGERLRASNGVVTLYWPIESSSTSNTSMPFGLPLWPP